MGQDKTGFGPRGSFDRLDIRQFDRRCNFVRRISARPARLPRRARALANRPRLPDRIAGASTMRCSGLSDDLDRLTPEIARQQPQSTIGEVLNADPQCVTASRRPTRAED